MATLAPSSCRRLAVASPMPLFPPVTTATFPSSLFMFISPCLPDFPHDPLCRPEGFQHLDDHRSDRMQVSRDSVRKIRFFLAAGRRLRYTLDQSMDRAEIEKTSKALADETRLRIFEAI